MLFLVPPHSVNLFPLIFRKNSVRYRGGGPLRMIPVTRVFEPFPNRHWSLSFAIYVHFVGKCQMWIQWMGGSVYNLGTGVIHIVWVFEGL